jgi:hypothetical protein
MFKLFIKRPILSGVISVIIVCLGVLSILTLPITQFPDIVPPSVTVTARYTGASADVMSPVRACHQRSTRHDLHDHCLYQRRYVPHYYLF